MPTLVTLFFLFVCLTTLERQILNQNERVTCDIRVLIKFIYFKSMIVSNSTIHSECKQINKLYVEPVKSRSFYYCSVRIKINLMQTFCLNFKKCFVYINTQKFKIVLIFNRCKYYIQNRFFFYVIYATFQRGNKY